MNRLLGRARPGSSNALRAICAAIVCLLAAPLIPRACLAKEGMDRDARIAIIRGLLRESAVVKVAFPRGRKGLRIDSQGKLDIDDARKELRESGLAIQSGNPAQITGIDFKSSQIVFELNGGSKSGKKWYQHIEIGGGISTTPVTPSGENVASYGSSVMFDYGKPLPDMTVAQLKKILAGVLDFERHSPTELYAPNVSPEVRQAIKDHKVVVGMDRDAVLSSMGAPDRRVREDKDGTEFENWIYGLPPHVLYITFGGDQVTDVKQF